MVKSEIVTILIYFDGVMTLTKRLYVFSKFKNLEKPFDYVPVCTTNQGILAALIFVDKCC